MRRGFWHRRRELRAADGAGKDAEQRCVLGWSLGSQGKLWSRNYSTELRTKELASVPSHPSLTD